MKIQETLYIGQWCLSPFQSRHLGASHISPRVSSTVQKTLKNPFLELPSAAQSYFLESHWWSEISSLSKVILVLEKARSQGCQICAVGGWVTWVIWCFTKNLCMRCNAWVAHCHDEAVDHQLPMAEALFVIYISQLMKNTKAVFLINCLAWRDALVMDSIFPIRKHSKHGLDLAMTLLGLLQVWRTRRLPLGWLGLCLWIIAINQWFISSYDLPEEIWFIGSGLNQVTGNCSTMFLLH